MKTDSDIVLDLDRERIKTILHEAYTSCRTYLQTDFNITEDQFVDQINVYLDSNRVTIPVSLGLPSKAYPEMQIEVNLRRKKVFVRMRSAKKQAEMNYYLKTL